MLCPVVDTHHGWESYWQSRSRNLRHKIERCIRRAREMGELSIDVRSRFAGPEEELEDLLREGFEVEGSGWKAAEGTAIKLSPSSRRYYSDLARWASGEGWLRLTFVRLDGRAIAFGLGVEGLGVHHALKIGYDPAVARLSPGSLLLHALIRHAFDTGLERFDFAGHLEPYKGVWATDIEKHLSLIAFPVDARRQSRIPARDHARCARRESGRSGPGIVPLGCQAPDSFFARDPRRSGAARPGSRMDVETSV